MSARWATFLALGLAVSVLCPAAQPPALRLPSLAPMERDAVESVNITLGGFSLGLMRFVMRHADEQNDPQAEAVSEVLRGLKKVQVHHYQFKRDHVYAQADLESLRSQLATPDWHQIVQVRNHENNEDVDIYCSLDNDKITGMVILAAKPREFTLVNIVGEVDPNQIAALRRTFASDGP
ncbi:MAG TPA: DUF4252 domain-containing protein [Steroidobacteraceae bacterium]|jgi:hypothetical protein